MSRIARKPTSDPRPETNMELANIDAAQLPVLAAHLKTQQSNAVALAEQLGYTGALTVGGLEDEIKFYQRRSVEAVLETGKRLILLKEITDHGEFISSLDRLGLQSRLVQKLMQATVKFSNAPSTALLTSPGMSQTKLLELLVLDEGEIEALDQGDTVRGLTLDKIDCMSVSELRRALRIAEAEQSAKVKDLDAVIVQKEAKIDDLVKALNRREGMTDAEQHADLEHELTSAMLVAIGELQVVRGRIHNISALKRRPQGLVVASANALQRIVSEAMSIATDYGIHLILASDLEAYASGCNANAAELPAAPDWVAKAN